MDPGIISALLGVASIVVEYVLRPILSLFGLERLVMPRIEMGAPEQHADETYLAWWHVPVALPRRWWQLQRDRERCRARIIIAGTPIAEPLAFSGNPEPEEVVTLHFGEAPRWIPVAIRSLVDVDISAATVRRYPPFHVVARCARVTDLLTLQGGRVGEGIARQLELRSDAVHPITIEVSSRDVVVAQQQYLLYVPPQRADNGGFVLERASAHGTRAPAYAGAPQNLGSPPP